MGDVSGAVAGGFFGNTSRAKVENCVAEGNVTGTIAGGFLGEVKTQQDNFLDEHILILNSTATGTVLGDKKVGGFIGEAMNTTHSSGVATTVRVEDCSASPVVAGASDSITVEAILIQTDNDPNIEIINTKPGTIIIPPEGETITINRDGSITVPAGSTIGDNVADKEVTIDKNGNIIPEKEQPDENKDRGSSYSLEQITSDSKYAVNVDVTGDGTAKIDEKTAGKGSTVTITVAPDEGSDFVRLVVTDKYGDVIDIVDQGNGEYTFRMPGCKVSVEAYFTTAVVEEPETAERTMILTIGDRVATVNGEYVENDVAPVIRNERTMLPARFVAEELGATVAWDEAAQKVTITKGETVIEIYINQPFAFVNNESIELDSPAFIENGRTYLPLRFITENLGAEVAWDAEAQKVIIKY